MKDTLNANNPRVWAVLLEYNSEIKKSQTKKKVS